jgi:hypothetical protein
MTRSVGPAKNRMLVAHLPSIAARWQRAARPGLWIERCFRPDALSL